MQRLFIMFPAGLPGLALVSLRGSVALAMLLATYDQAHHFPVWVQAAMTVAAVCTVAGLYTPIASFTALTFHFVMWTAFGAGQTLAWIIVCLDACALTLLGPGAYSIDSRLFGRRLVLPPS